MICREQFPWNIAVGCLKSSEIALVSFVAAFTAAVFSFVVVSPAYGPNWGFEWAGIVFIVFFILAIFIGLGDYSDKPPKQSDIVEQ